MSRVTRSAATVLTESLSVGSRRRLFSPFGLSGLNRHRSSNPPHRFTGEDDNCDGLNVKRFAACRQHSGLDSCSFNRQIARYHQFVPFDRLVADGHPHKKT